MAGGRPEQRAAGGPSERSQVGRAGRWLQVRSEGDPGPGNSPGSSLQGGCIFSFRPWESPAPGVRPGRARAWPLGQWPSEMAKLRPREV